MEHNFGKSLKLYIVSPIWKPLRFKRQDKIKKSCNNTQVSTLVQSGEWQPVRAKHLVIFDKGYLS